MTVVAAEPCGKPGRGRQRHASKLHCSETSTPDYTMASVKYNWVTRRCLNCATLTLGSDCFAIRSTQNVFRQGSRLNARLRST